MIPTGSARDAPAQDCVAIHELLLPMLRAVAPCIRSLHALLEILNLLCAFVCAIVRACVRLCLCVVVVVAVSSQYLTWARLWAIPPGPKKKYGGAILHLPKKWSHKGQLPIF